LAGAPPQTPLGELTSLPDLLAGLKGSYILREGREGRKEMAREGRRWEGRRRDRREGKRTSERSPSFKFTTTPLGVLPSAHHSVNRKCFKPFTYGTEVHPINDYSQNIVRFLGTSSVISRPRTGPLPWTLVGDFRFPDPLYWTSS